MPLRFDNEVNMKFKQNYKVLFHDTDTNGIIFPSRLFMFLQETAHGHTNSVGCSPDVMIKRDGGCFWLTRICVSVLSDIKAGDELEVVTFATDDSRGFSFNRCFEVYRDGEKVCEAYSVWVLMNLSEMKPMAVKDWNFDLGLEAPVKPSAPLHVRIPKDIVMTESGTQTVYYRDIDYNGHMNNARYPDVICGFLDSKELMGKRVGEISISFMHEAARGETIKGFYGKYTDGDDDGDGIFYVRSLRTSDGNINVEARIKLVNTDSNEGMIFR